MADNVTFQSSTLATPASGTVVATDDDGTAQHQYVKVEWGGDGTQTPVASGASALPIQDGGNSITVDGTVSVSGSVTVDLGANNDVTVTGTVDLGATDNAVLDAIAASIAGTLTVGSHAVTDGGGSLTVDAPVGTPVFVRLSDGSSAISTLPVSLASVPSHAVTNAGTFAVQASSTVLPTANATSAVTSVADTATSTTLLSSSGTRKGFRITNTSSAVLYVKYGTTASATDFTVRMPQYAYLEENFYSGRVDGVWATDPGDGAALITSLSA